MCLKRMNQKGGLENPDEEKSEKLREDLEKCHMLYAGRVLRRE